MKLKPSTVSAVNALDAMLAKMDVIREQLSLDTLTERPAGGITVTEYASRYKCNRPVAENHLSKMVDAGLMTRHRVRMVTENGQCRVSFVYVPR